MLQDVARHYISESGGQIISRTTASKSPSRNYYKKAKSSFKEFSPLQRCKPEPNFFFQLHTNQNILDLKVLYRALDHPDRKIAESIHIRRRAPALNIQGSSLPIMRVV